MDGRDRDSWSGGSCLNTILRPRLWTLLVKHNNNISVVITSLFFYQPRMHVVGMAGKYSRNSGKIQVFRRGVLPTNLPTNHRRHRHHDTLTPFSSTTSGIRLPFQKAPLLYGDLSVLHTFFVRYHDDAGEEIIVLFPQQITNESLERHEHSTMIR